MTRNIAFSLTMGAAALVLVGTKYVSAQHAAHQVTQVASSSSNVDDTTKSGYIIASS